MVTHFCGRKAFELQAKTFNSHKVPFYYKLQQFIIFNKNRYLLGDHVISNKWQPKLDLYCVLFWLLTVPYFFVIERLLVQAAILVLYVPRGRASRFIAPLSRFDTHSRWLPLTQSARSWRSYGKIRDCEQSNQASGLKFILLKILKHTCHVNMLTEH